MVAIPDSDVSVFDLLGSALESSARKTGLGDGAEALHRIRGGDCTVCEYLRYGLAEGVAECLGEADGTVRAVYIYDPERASDEEGINTSPGIHLIVWVSRRSAALDALIEVLRRTLAEQREQFACAQSQALCGALDVQVADDAQVSERTGYGALLTSLYVRPTPVWRR